MRELLGLVIHHPATIAFIKEGEVALLLDELREKMPADELEAALERGKVLDLDTVAAEILAELSALENGGSDDAE